MVQDEQVIDHLGINCADLNAAATFYDRVLGYRVFAILTPPTASPRKRR